MLVPADRRSRRLRARRAPEGDRADRFGYLLDFSPQYDAIYLQWMLALYSLDGDPALYALAADNARDAQTRAAQRQGPVPALLERRNAARAPTPRPGMLQTQAATTSLFAWLAVYRRRR